MRRCPFLVTNRPAQHSAGTVLQLWSVGSCAVLGIFAFPNTSESAASFFAFAHDIFRRLVASKPQINGMPHLA